MVILSLLAKLERPTIWIKISLKPNRLWDLLQVNFKIKGLRIQQTLFGMKKESQIKHNDENDYVQRNTKQYPLKQQAGKDEIFGVRHSKYGGALFPGQIIIRRLKESTAGSSSSSFETVVPGASTHLVSLPLDPLLVQARTLEMDILNAK